MFSFLKLANITTIGFFVILKPISMKMNETRKQRIIDLLQRYKKNFFETPLSKDGANELYKWQLITNCHNKTDVEIIHNFKSKNVVHVKTVYPVLTELLKNNQQQLADCFNGLKDENRSLSERLSIFKKAMGNLCGDKFKSKANDERTAAAFLTCWKPEKYTFFIDTKVYSPYCNYIGEQHYETGEKYPHYLRLIEELAAIIRQDPELNDKFRNETKGLIQSDLLIAQNILWQMKDSIILSDDIECIIANITWNSNDWKETSSDNSGHKWVQEGGVPHESWNFDFDNKRNTDDKVFGYAKFTNQPKDYQNKKYFVIFRSRNNIVGFYGNTTINDYIGISKNESYNMIGDKSLSLLLENRIDDSSKELLFGKKRVGQNGFNNITKGNALAILEKAKEMNPNENKIDKIKNWLLQNKNNMKSNIAQIKDLLSLKKNIILQGAPGTGKTYNTAALALSICGETIPEKHEDVMKRYGELQKEGRIGFCTFHQSMDYEDFVEGIKPKTVNEQVLYEIEPGIFKTMCENAKSIITEKKSEKIDFSKTRVFKMSLGEKGKNDAEIFDYCLENNVVGLGWGGDKDFSQCKTREDFKALDDTWGAFAMEVFKQWMQMGDIILISDGTKSVKAIARIAGDYEFRKDAPIDMCQFRKVEWLYTGDLIPISKLYDKNLSQQSIYAFYFTPRYGKPDFNGTIKVDVINDIITGKVDDETPQNYVLIIDEINRGNVSKIFGELITLLEADKRLGGDHPIKVTLPYSKESFGVPSNLYIIGTMNTTDRSVGNIDYAVRRRFAFVTLKADRQILVNEYGEESKQVQLFDAVFTFLNDDKKHPDMDIDDLMVGHSYFMADDDKELKLKLEYEIIPLIREYYKDGIVNVKKDELEKAFNDWKTAI